ncbi:SIR2 family protein [Pectinatus frisingensis]|uniref:SIR2 family protein n=1 Tax=Pectinatus frisingensis TaxID=865 RepID=UPI001E2F39C6|nr:SIR2 family protein [Pectinatus frisingensis]
MGDNIIKIRDDKEPIYFTLLGKEFKLSRNDKHVKWCSNNTFSELDLHERIEPWLTALFQSEHLSLLVGSGLTTAIQKVANKEANNGMCAFTPTSHYADQIKLKATESAKETGRGDNPNCEDYIRIMNELLKGLEIMGDHNDEYIELKEEINKVINNFTKNISEIEHQIIFTAEDKKIEAFNTLVMFLMSFASRTGTRDRLNIFTTNYDRLIEAGADIAGLHLIDRFVGSLTPIFRSSRLDIDMHYNPPGIRGEPRYLEGVAKYTKLHGSIDWLSINKNIRKISLPFGATDIDPYFKMPKYKLENCVQNVPDVPDFSRIMIYPNSSKDRETAEYPYVELFRDFAAALCRPNSTLVTYGYSFGDEHINRVICDMLTIPSTHLVVLSYDDPMNRIINLCTNSGRLSQISLLIGNDVANINSLIKYYLPRPSIDRHTIRMAELLRQRYDQPDTIKKPSKEDESKDVDTFS